jgi:hypothetical protein
MFRKIRDFFRDFDKEVLEKGENHDTVKANPEAKKQYEKSEYDFRGNK